MIDSTKLPLINILTRSGSRKKKFLILKKSILDQSYKNIRHIISCDQPKCSFLKNEEVVCVEKQPKKGRCYYNLYLNKLAETVDDGWIIILDDDSKLIHKHFLLELARKCVSTPHNKVIIYQSKYHNTVLPKKKKIVKCGIDMCCFCFHHSVKNKFKFDADCGGDYNFLCKIEKSKTHTFQFCKSLPLGIHGNYNGPQLGK